MFGLFKKKKRVRKATNQIQNFIKRSVWAFKNKQK